MSNSEVISFRQSTRVVEVEARERETNSPADGRVQAAEYRKGSAGKMSRFANRFRRRPIMSPWVLVDFGTQVLKISVDGMGILAVPSFVNRTSDGTVVAVGEEAKRCWEKDTINRRVACPIKAGVVSNNDLAEELLKYSLEEYLGSHGIQLVRPQIIFAVPTMTAQQNVLGAARVVEKVFRTKNIRVVDEAMAAAVSTDAGASEPDGLLVIDIGGGTTDMAVVAQNEFVPGGRKCVVGGSTGMNRAIVQMLKEEVRVDIGEPTAERIKERIGYAVMPSDDPSYKVGGKVRGEDMDQLHKDVEVRASQVHRAIMPQIRDIHNGLRDLLSKVPSEMSQSILEHGAYLTGGGSQLKGMAESIRTGTGVECVVIENPAQAVIRGMVKISQDRNLRNEVAVLPENWRGDS